MALGRSGALRLEDRTGKSRPVPSRTANGLLYPFPPQQTLGLPLRPEIVVARMAELQTVPAHHRPREEDVRLGWSETCLPPWDHRYPEPFYMAPT